jgi:hypothetical protein
MQKSPLDAGKLRRILELARNAVNALKPDRAIELVTSLGLDGEQEGFERFWAESRLVLAEAYMTKCDPVAETFFEEALSAIASLPENDSMLEMRTNEHYADYLSNFAGCRSKARPRYDLAKRLAVSNHLDEDSANIQLKVELLELTIDNHPELENFQMFKGLAERGGYTHQDQLATWMQYRGAVPETLRGLKFARKKNSVSPQYFLSLLESVKLKPK